MRRRRSLNPFRTPFIPPQNVVGGSNPSVDLAAEKVQSQPGAQMAQRIYAPNAIINNADESNQSIKENMIDNVYLPSVTPVADAGNPQSSMTNAFLKWWKGE